MNATNTAQPLEAPTVRRQLPLLRRRWLLIVLALVLLFLAWAAIDLYGPRQTDVRRFDPAEVARLDTEMWRSYYARERFLLFRQLAELLRTQYRLPFLRSNLVAYKAAKAAFVFKEGKSRSDYEKALPYLLSFYAEICKVSNVEFNVERAARLELEWWIIHRERAKYQPDDLERALAEAAAEIYQVPVETLSEHAYLRTEAMRIRDTKAESGGVTEEDWKQINELLRASWLSLSRVVNAWTRAKD
ncbi:MAG TPA: hypothetical protein VM911_20290 [Pyrinomonadaceae bacterium]|jgi:hypothetical protein|nr:hypothetical protein [Pyrinomonadaceae bacterium]